MNETPCAAHDDSLALLALGEVVDAATVEHVRSCADCASTLSSLQRVAAAGRAITEQDRPQPVPMDLWARIQSEALPATARLQPWSGADTSSTVRPIASNPAPSRTRRRSWAAAAVAAACGLVIGGGAVWLATSAGSSAEQLASASLTGVDSGAQIGAAALQRLDGATELRVDAAALPALADGYYEVWMATADTKTMVAVGTVNPGSSAVLQLPAGMDVEQFPVVDISHEHFDGNTGHSAVSVARATF